MSDRPTPKPRPKPRPQPRPSIQRENVQTPESSSFVTDTAQTQFSNRPIPKPQLNDFYSVSGNAPALSVNDLNSVAFMPSTFHNEPTNKTTVDKLGYQQGGYKSPPAKLKFNMVEELSQLRDEVFVQMQKNGPEDMFKDIVLQLASFDYNVNEKYAFLSFKDLLKKNAV